MSANPVLDFNSATTATEVLEAIAAHNAALLDTASQAEYALIPNGSGRQTAVADGILEIKKFFGDFTAETLAAALDHQVNVEYNKYVFITDINTARGEEAAEDIAATLLAQVGTLNDQRQDLIAEWSAVQNNAPLAVRVAELKTDPYTIILKALDARLDDADAANFLAELTAKFVETRGESQYFGVWALADALDKADDAVDPVYAFNSAANDADAIAAIKYHAATLELSDEALGHLTELPDGGGREKAIGLGVNEIRDLFGDFISEAQIKTAVEKQISVEFAKHEFIKAFAEATTAGAVVDVLTGPVLKNVNDDRQELIAEWSLSTLPAVQKRVAELKSDHYTVALKALYDRLGDTETGNAFRDNLSTKFAEIRGERSFVSIVELIKDLDKAGDAVDARYAFNSATTTTEMIEAIKAHYVALLDDTSEDEFEFIPDGSGRQKAVADGVLEIKKFFGDFATEAKVIEALDLQVSVEYNKFVFIQAVDNAADAAAIAKALTDYVGDLNDQRQGLITEWSKYPENTALAARVAQLKADNYTKALAALDARLGNAELVADVAEALLAERTEAGGRLNSVVTITNIIGEAVEAGNVAPDAPDTKTVTIDEDTSAMAVDIEAADLDGDELTYTIKDTAKPQKGTVTFDQVNGTFTYKPAANVNGTDTFTIVVSDGNGGTVEQKVTVNIAAVNDTPWDIALSGNQVAENSKAGTEVGKLTGSDHDGDALTFTLLDNAGSRFVIDATGTLKVADGATLDFEQATSHTVEVQVKDSAGTTYEETLTVDLTDVASENVTGTTGTDDLVGGAGKDVFNGGLGNDKLSGGLDNDTLTGGKGRDVFVFDTKLGTSSTDRKVNFDTIKDFSVKDDSLYLDNAIFKKLGSGTAASPKQLSKSFFTIGDKAKDKNDYIIYNDKTGVLSYDADGSGKGKAVEFAQLSKKLTTLSYKDFFVI
jgi:Ca2+-binding RTX toxin-like protein